MINTLLILVGKLKGSSLTATQVTHSLVHNPIYDGPVYESVQTHFDSLTTQVTTATSANNFSTKSPQSNLAVSVSVDNTTDKC